MRIFNLTEHPLDFHKKMIPANGGSADFPEMTSLTIRDHMLVARKVLAIGDLPAWWAPKGGFVLVPQPQPPVAIPIGLVELVAKPPKTKSVLSPKDEEVVDITAKAEKPKR